jgi:hypothetical protein
MAMPDDKPQDSLLEFHDDVAAEAVKIALAEADRGVFENDNDNRGPRVDEYQLVGGTLGQPWCGKFVCWCFQQAALKLGFPNPFPRIFAAGPLEKWGEQKKRLVVKPQRGNVLIWKHRHVALVTGSALDNGIVPSVEGNTWTGKIRKDGVYARKVREVSECKFVRL